MRIEMERRSLPGRVEFRSADNGPGVLAGYAAVFNKLSQNLGGFVERIAPDAFSKTLADGGPVVARFNHNDDYLLGTLEADTLRLSVDGTGLRYEVDLPDTSTGRDIAVLAQRGDLRYSSFAFRTIADDWGFTPDDFPLRTLNEVSLMDVAPVVNPAYRDTTTGLRSLAEKLDIDLEDVKQAALHNDLRNLLTKDSSLGGESTDSTPGETHGLTVAHYRSLYRM